MNIVIISGRLTRDCEILETAGGTAIVKFAIAVNNRMKDKSGEWVDKPSFVDCKMFGKRAAAVSKRLLKGTPVSVDGHLLQEEWTSNGQRRTALLVIVDNLELQPKAKAETQPEADAYAEPADAYGEEIPF